MTERYLSHPFADMSRVPGNEMTLAGGEGCWVVDTAGKLARRYWHVRGERQRRILIAREGAYRGMAAFGTSLAGIAPNRAGWGPLVVEVVHVDAHHAGAIAEALDRHSGAVAGFIGEPVIGAVGVHPPREGYWEQVQALCREHDVLLITEDELGLLAGVLCDALDETADELMQEAGQVDGADRQTA